MNLLQELNIKENFDNFLLLAVLLFLLKEGGEDMITIGAIALLIFS